MIFSKIMNEGRRNMASFSITGVSLVLRYKSGSFTFSSLKPATGNAALYELGSAINSLQAEPAVSLNKIVKSRVTSE